MLNKKMTKKTHGQRISWNIIVVYNNIKPRPFGNLRGWSVWVARRTRTVENFIITRHFSRSHSNFLLIFFNNFCIQWKVENTLHKAPHSCFLSCAYLFIYIVIISFRLWSPARFPHILQSDWLIRAPDSAVHTIKTL